jgi:glycosyltransferase involved in cell wall biosynthesis
LRHALGATQREAGIHVGMSRGPGGKAGDGCRPLILLSAHGGLDHPSEIERPQTDFDALAARVDGRISRPGAGASPVAAAEKRLRLGISQAVRAWRSRASVYVSLSERVGIPLSLLRPNAPHVMVAHLLTSREKRLAARRTQFLRRTDVTLVFSAEQERYLREDVGLDEQQAQFIWDKVDHRFFAPGAPAGGDGYVLSVGREQRDYAALIEALRPLKVPSVIVPGSTWSHRGLEALSVPEHVQIRESLTYPELRRLYQGARAVVVPVHPGTAYAAGVNGILEGMACARPVIATDTPGLRGYVEDGVNGRQVPAGDPDALRSVIQELWEGRDRAEALGRAGRETVEGGRTIDHFVNRVAGVMESLV